MSDTKKIVNVIITNVSSINPEYYQKRRYIYEDDEINEENTIEGWVTNEPPIKYLIKDLKSKNQKLDKVILITSNEANEKIKKPEIRDNKNNNIEADYRIELIDKIKKFCNQENITINCSDINNIIDLKQNKLIIKKSNNNNELIVEIQKDIPKNQFEQKFGYDKVSSVRVLTDNISEFCEEKGFDCPNMDTCIDLGEGNKDSDVTSAITEVSSKLIELLQDKDTQVNLYIEANGGIRYVLVMLIAIINALETVYDNIKLKKIFSMVLSDRDKDGRIYIRDTSMIYASIELVSAIKEFINYGRIKSLQDYFKKRKEISKHKNLDNFSEEVFDDINKCVNNLSQLADNLQLCRTEQIINSFYGTNDTNSIKEVLEEFKNKYDKDDINNSDAKVFNDVIKNILQEYKDIYNNTDKYQNKFLNLPKIIQWCIDKDYIQQALTLCSERLPKYIVENGIVTINETLKEATSKSKKNYEENYHFLVQYIYSSYYKFVSYSKLYELLDLYKKQYNLYNILSEEKQEKLSDIENISKKLNDIIKINNREKTAWVNSVKKSFEDLIVEDNQKLEELLNEVDKVIPDIKNETNNNNKKFDRIIDKYLKNFKFDEYTKDYNKYLSKAEEFSQQLKKQIEAISKGTINNKNQYNKDSLKYAYFYLFDDKYLTTSDMDTFIKMQVIYGILKQQRNLSNHASDGNRQQSDNVLSMEQIKVLIKEELNVINEYNNKHNK